MRTSRLANPYGVLNTLYWPIDSLINQNFLCPLKTRAEMKLLTMAGLVL